VDAAQAKIAQIFEAIGLNGAKMETFDNPGPLEPLLHCTSLHYDSGHKPL